MSGATSPAPWRTAFDNARDPYTARNALGLAGTGAAGALGNVIMPLTYDILTIPHEVTPAAETGNIFVLTATDAVAFTINAPTNPSDGQVITFIIRNESGGAMGAITWDPVFKMPAFVTPATGNSRAISFMYDGTNWLMIWMNTVDVPN